jgi:N-acetylmuramoyl-L-alanine amidase
VATLVFAPAAHAAPPAISAQASPATGAAPLQVTLSASGDAASYHWDLGDGATAEGALVSHAYAAGRFTARVTATSATGETAQATVTVTSFGLTLSGPRTAPYRQKVRLHGHLVPGLPRIGVSLYRGERWLGSAKTRRNGRFSVQARVGRPDQQFTARYGGAVSNPLRLAVRPGIDAAFQGSGLIGRPLVLAVRVRPASAGALTARVRRDGRLVKTLRGRDSLRVRLGTRRAGLYHVALTLAPAPGFLRAGEKVEQAVFVPTLGPGDGGASVRALEERLLELHYALGGVDGYYGGDDVDAVTAFQKLHGLARTGSVDVRFWSELQRADVPRARYAGGHVEVSKERQVLLIVRDGRVTLVVPVSTGATGNTPLGLWHVYSKVPGYNAVQMYYSSFFVGGFAIHGYHSVPPYPASHGCVRIPLWVAQRVYSLIGYGTAIYIY